MELTELLRGGAGERSVNTCAHALTQPLHPFFLQLYVHVYVYCIGGVAVVGGVEVACHDGVHRAGGGGARGGLARPQRRLPIGRLGPTATNRVAPRRTEERASPSLC